MRSGAQQSRAAAQGPAFRAAAQVVQNAKQQGHRVFFRVQAAQQPAWPSFAARARAQSNRGRVFFRVEAAQQPARPRLAGHHTLKMSGSQASTPCDCVRCAVVCMYLPVTMACRLGAHCVCAASVGAKVSTKGQTIILGLS